MMSNLISEPFLSYATSKILIYLFLSEKVLIVWSAGKALSRFKSIPYISCLVVLTGFVVVFVLMLIARIGYIRGDGACVIGLGKIAYVVLGLTLRQCADHSFRVPRSTARSRSLHTTCSLISSSPVSSLLPSSGQSSPPLSSRNSRARPS